MSRSENGAVNAATMTLLIIASVVSVGFGMSDLCCFSVAFALFVAIGFLGGVAPLLSSRWAVGLPAPGVSYGFGDASLSGISV